VIVALAFGLLASGTSLGVFEELWTSSFGTPRGVEDVATLALPLLLTGLAAAIPLRLGLWNIGGEGQLFMGAWAAAGVAFLFPGLSSAFLIPAMIAASLVGGALWVLVPALARVRLNVNEIITTLLLNYVAAYWLLYWVSKQWRDPLSLGGVKSKPLPETAEVTAVSFGSVEIPVGFLIGVAAALFVAFFMHRTRIGYEFSILGASPAAARFAGIPARRLLVFSLLAGGALAGLAGALEMMGNVHRYGYALSNNTGYTGIVIAVLAGGSPLGVLALSIVFALIQITGGIFRAEGASAEIVLAMYGLILMVAAIGQGLMRFKFVRRSTDSNEPGGDRAALDSGPAGAEGSRVR
jgi:simple sugar transport system permease protein